MENTKSTSLTLPDITFPVFYLNPELQIREQNGVVFYNEKVLDDKNVAAETLGERRLRTPLQPQLARLIKMYASPQEFIRGRKQGHRKFIDSKGKIFTYQPTKFEPLKYHKIKDVILKETYCLVRLVDFPQKAFKEPRPPPADCFYASVLYRNNMPWFIYGYSPTKEKDTRRKI